MLVASAWAVLFRHPERPKPDRTGGPEQGPQTRKKNKAGTRLTPGSRANRVEPRPDAIETRDLPSRRLGIGFQNPESRKGRQAALPEVDGDRKPGLFDRRRSGQDGRSRCLLFDRVFGECLLFHCLFVGSLVAG
nr:hypothetical protein RKHAN_00223 [Rhizobium sp. Khangiran2]